MTTLPHNAEAHVSGHTVRLNWLRAAVLGANDGIVSLAALIVGVAAATETTHAIFLIGISGLLAGALSMAVGEYVSVSSQRDTERAWLTREKEELDTFPEEELQELVQLYRDKGLTEETAQRVAKELTEHDAFRAHIEAELGIDPEQLTNPWHAGIASAVAFASGALVPLLAVLLSPTTLRIPITFGAVLLALILTGALSAWASKAPILNAVSRVVGGGLLAMLITLFIGRAV